MEKVRLGVEMATRWTDPTIMLIVMVPYALAYVGTTALWGYHFWVAAAPWVTKGALPVGADLMALGKCFGWAVFPSFFTWLWWNIYHGWFEDKSVDTSLFVTFRDPAMAKYWKHRRLPMCELYEWYIRCQVDWNPACEGGDCYLILLKHRHLFVNYKPTWRQISWLLIQFFPQWLTGAGLGHGSSSGKSIEETTKEIDEHYNKGNDVFSCILGRPMVYTCGIFHEVPQFAATGHKGDYTASANDLSLEQAQTNKMDMLCDKLQLKEGEHLLDIGCGWGTLLRHATYHYGAKATGVTLSREGKIYCDMASERTGIPTDVMLCDYRLIPQDQKFDKISSIEMAEHVGIKNFVDPYLKNVRRLLKNKDSMFLMQVAGLRQGSNWQDVAWALFMGKYVFPGADASTPLNWFVRQCELAGFEVHSVENIGNHYSHTLHKWYDNWMSHKDEILAGKVDAISEHSKGEHLFRLNEFTWAWCAIHAGHGGGTCYQLLMHPSEYDFPRDQWVDGQHVSSGHVTGVGYAPREKNHVYGENAAYAPDWGANLENVVHFSGRTPGKKSKKKQERKSSTKKSSTKKASSRKSSARKSPRSSRK